MNENAAARSSRNGPIGPVELSVVIPTFEERGNVVALLERLDAALTGIAWEVIFVDDDSADGTAALVKQLAVTDPRVRCLRRVSRRGLAGACIEGMLASSAPQVAVLDGDLQHDETLLPQMLERVKAGHDLVVGSRYLTGTTSAGFSDRRDRLSRAATWLAHRLSGVTLTDPMSGFFLLRRAAFDPLAADLSPHGFKILFDIVITARGRLRIAEVPYVFAARHSGASKLDAQVGLDFLGLLLNKVTRGAVTPRFLSFALVGASGVVVHLAALRACMRVGVAFAAAQAIATGVAILGNFLLNNRITYRDKRLSGGRMARGLLEYVAVTAVGAIANVGIAAWLYQGDAVWWVAGAAGAAMGAVWNFSMSNLFVWRVK